MQDKRLGRITADGVLYPALTLGGKAYTMPPGTVIGITDAVFVVQDDYPTYDVSEALEALKRALASMAEEENAHAEESGASRKRVRRTGDA